MSGIAGQQAATKLQKEEGYRHRTFQTSQKIWRRKISGRRDLLRESGRFSASLEPLDFRPQEENGPSYLHHAQASGFRVRADLSENLSGGGAL